MSEALQTNYSSRLPKKLADEIEQVAKEKRLNKDQKEKLAREIEKIYGNSRVEPGEAVGIIAAQSISEPATQMSIDSKEKIILKHNDVISIQAIGEFVDRTLERLGAIQDDGWEISDVSDAGFHVPSIGDDEKIKWNKVIACSRHHSPEKLLKIKTRSGRRIVATDSHSFVIRKDNDIVAVSGKSLKKGDRIPSVKYLPENCIESINIKSLSEMKFSRAKKPLPEFLPLDENTGWVFGAYISEGNGTPSFVSISNVEDNFLQKTREFADSLGLTYNEYDNFRGFAKGHDIHINSALLSDILAKTCGEGSGNKKIPSFAYSADEKFVKGLLQAYFEGDGNISVERGVIRASSNSKELIGGLSLLLTRFGIFSYKSGGKQFNLTIPAKYARVFREKIGFVSEENSRRLDELCKQNPKQDFVELVSGFGDLFLRVARKLDYPTRYVNNFTNRQKIGKEVLLKYISVFSNLAKEKNVDISGELKIMKTMQAADVVWDEIVDLDYVEPSSKYVYDLTVEESETFTTFEGIVTHNTMRTYHFAGTAGIRVTYGLPRLIEIFDAKKEPETPLMIIYLKKQFNTSEHATKLAEEIIEKKVLNVVKKVSLNLNENSVELELQDKKRTDTVIKILKENFKEFSVRSRGEKISVAAKAEIDISGMQKLKEKILGVHVSGLKDISNAVVLKEGDDWIVNTIGSNLEKVLTIDEVDEKRTLTNDIHETEKILGIEAARNTIIREALKTMQEQALDIDVRHVMLVGDIMTFRGDVRPIGRYGVAGAKSSILARAAFEETIKHLVRASVRKEVDNFTGIFENVMIGQVVPAGTGMFDLIARFEKEEKEKEDGKK